MEQPCLITEKEASLVSRYLASSQAQGVQHPFLSMSSVSDESGLSGEIRAPS